MIVVDVTKCSGCGMCEMACSFQRDKEYSRFRSVIKLMKEEALRLDYPVTCITCCCCVEACPEGALSLTSKGLIKLDSEKCTGCRTCETACPVGVIEFDEKPLFCTNCGKCVKGCANFGNGSLYLQIKHELCVNCNQCSIAQSCPAQAIQRQPTSNPYILKPGYKTDKT